MTEAFISCDLKTYLSFLSERKSKLTDSELRIKESLLQAFDPKYGTVDSLTNLPNRNSGNRKVIEKYHGKSCSISFFMLDIDKFKSINSRYGYEGGDEVLKNVAKAIKEVVTKVGGIYSRQGGDEFRICVDGLNSEQLKELSTELKRKIRDYNKKIQVGGKKIDIDVSTSIGICTIDKSKDEDISKTLARGFTEAEDKLREEKEKKEMRLNEISLKQKSTPSIKIDRP
jgi:diguanylate cyclase (GGDEF)-like protein